ncbi:MAG: hypothetical protein GF346_04060, partial [Candidatus Eisenbacteria bacterium]|nr:hypothetical protein [Candidatus Latescibacterota bacterium]MBD3301600.1 hypothetical protein [Candidatus Eisenbacteria bacterium]
QLRGGSAVAGWLRTIGVRLSLNRVRRDRFRRMVSLEREGEAIGPPAVDRDRILERVRAEIATLPPAEREVFLLRQEGWSYREIAGRRGHSEATARVLYFRAIRRLRRIVEEEE